MLTLTPIRSQRDVASGSSSSRVDVDFVAMAFFHASGVGELRRFVSNPTPSRVVLAGRYAIMVATRGHARVCR
jgi:hypothetical protein